MLIPDFFIKKTKNFHKSMRVRQKENIEKREKKMKEQGKGENNKKHFFTFTFI